MGGNTIQIRKFRLITKFKLIDEENVFLIHSREFAYIGIKLMHSKQKGENNFFSVFGVNQISEILKYQTNVKLQAIRFIGVSVLVIVDVDF